MTTTEQNRATAMGKHRPTFAVTLRSNNEYQNKTRSREELDRTTNLVENFDDLLARLKHMIDDGNARIERKIDSSNASLVNEIATLRDEVHQLKFDCARDFNQLRDSHARTDAEVQKNRDAVDRLSKSNDLILTGVPYSPAENTRSLFIKLAAVLEYGDTNIPLVFTKRLARAPVTNGSTPPMLLQFAFRAVRDEFFLRYLSRKNLSLSHLGFNVERRIFLNENLTESARNIKGIALQLKRAGRIQNVISKAGVIYVKPKDDVAVQPIFHVRQLDKYGHRL